LKVIKADLLDENGQIIIRKTCPIHGEFEDTYWSDSRLYRWAERYAWDGDGLSNPRTKRQKGCPYDCGICNEHKSATVLAIVDITNRCNLRCPVCFANAAAAGYLYEPTKEQIKGILENFRSNMPHPPSALQLSGGEPTVRDDLPEIIRMAKQVGFEHIEVNTNGLRTAQNPDYIKELAEAGMDTFYLSFDGLTPEVYKSKAGVDLLQVKLKAIENARKAGLQSVVLVPVLIRGVNEKQVGDIIRFAVKNSDVIRGVNFQPVSICGRIDREKLREMRITIPDLMKLCEDQTNGDIRESDWYPIPSCVPISKAVGAIKGRRYSEFTCHPHCGAATFIFTENEKITPLPRLGNVDGFLRVMKKTYEDASAGKKTRAKLRLMSSLRYVNHKLLPTLSSILTEGSYGALANLMHKTILIGCMHFMDPYNFDLERVQRCTIHYGVPNGHIIPFCTMNTLHRPAIEKELSVDYRANTT